MSASAGAAHELLTLNVKVSQKGYLYIYLSNENDKLVDVFFDDLKVAHHTGVEQSDDYYPFGLTFNTYHRENSISNQFKFNGIEEQDELGLNVLLADFRMNDPAIGRWWQIDPKAVEWEGPFSAMGNNPILNTDPLGDTTIVYDINGQTVGKLISDGLPNQVHFVKNSIERNEKDSDVDYAKRVRASSVAFIGSNTGRDMQTISEMSNNLGVEVGFVGVVGEDREIRLGALPPDESNTATGITVAGLSNQLSKTDFDRKDLFLWGHTHPEKAFEKNYGRNPSMMNTDPGNRERITATPSGDVFNGNGPLDYRQALWRTTPALLVTSKSVSIYSADGIGGHVGAYHTYKRKSFRSK